MNRSIEERVASLEQSARTWRRLAAASLAALAIFSLCAFSQPTPTTVSTSEIRLLDNEGRCRILLSARDNNPMVTVLDEDGKSQCSLGAIKGVSGLFLRPSDDGGGAGLTISDKGSLLLMNGAEDGAYIAARVDGESSYLGLFGPDKVQQIAMGAERSQTVLVCQDPSSKAQVSAGMRDGQAGLNLTGHKGTQLVSLLAKDGSTSGVMCFDDDAKPVWSAPK
ncbi:MAG TPA: hypothetical protein VK176_01705 [Phycisphaerales bacterium]|nr:hypothetical protein [Phycisphaerales bacterium]